MVKSVGSMGPLCSQTVEYLLNTERRTFSEIATFFECTYFDAYHFARAQKIAIKVAKSGRRIDPKIRAEAERLLTTTNMPIIEIQQKLGLRSRHSIYLIRQRLEREQTRLAVTEEAEAGMSFVDTPQRQELRRCPEHGRVTVWPCVQCAAQKFRQQNKVNRPQLLFSSGSR